MGAAAHRRFGRDRFGAPRLASGPPPGATDPYPGDGDAPAYGGRLHHTHLRRAGGRTGAARPGFQLPGLDPGKKRTGPPPLDRRHLPRTAHAPGRVARRDRSATGRHPSGHPPDPRLPARRSYAAGAAGGRSVSACPFRCRRPDLSQIFRIPDGSSGTGAGGSAERIRAQGDRPALRAGRGRGRDSFRRPYPPGPAFRQPAGEFPQLHRSRRGAGRSSGTGAKLGHDPFPGQRPRGARG